MNPSKPAERPFFRDWKFWLAVLSLAFGVLKYLDARAEHRRREIVDRQLREAQDSLRHARDSLYAERAREKDNLTVFSFEYLRHLTDLSSAVSRYRETKKPEAITDLRSSARAMVSFIQKWRTVLLRLAPRMDGSIDALDRAASAGNLEAIDYLVRVLRNNLDSDIAALKAAIAQLANRDSIQ